jgi:7-cyano-7-deazaguanine synthase
MKAVVILSGGMDSTALAYWAVAAGADVRLLSFDYGQRHVTELHHARRIAERLGLPHAVLDLRGLRDLLPGSALTDAAVDVPEGHYAAPSMKATVVPNRNAIMLAIAYGHAVAHACDAVLFGAHAGDHTIYPDCRTPFVETLNAALRIGNEWADPVPSVLAPFVRKTKADIAVLGDGLGVPWGDTWSCYAGGARHCGRCGTCVERIEAFREGGVVDPTEYEAA